MDNAAFMFGMQPNWLPWPKSLIKHSNFVERKFNFSNDELDTAALASAATVACAAALASAAALVSEAALASAAASLDLQILGSSLEI
jgi:hypothetical protein